MGINSDASTQTALIAEVLAEGHRRQLEGHLLHPTPRERYQAATHQAAMLERSGELALASREWQAAAELAFTHADRHWCESRAQWCARHAKA